MLTHREPAAVDGGREDESRDPRDSGTLAIDDETLAAAGEGAAVVLRATALALGARLGWDAAEVASFGAKLAGRPWPDLDAPELLRVVDEYWRLGQAVAARRARRGLGARGGDRAAR